MIHPAEVAEILAGIMPNAEVLMFEDGDDLYASVPMIIARVAQFLQS